MLTDQQIEAAKGKVSYSTTDGGHHEHPDCIRIAYEWLDAQVKTKGRGKKRRALKHLIEEWGGRYVSQSDVDVAAYLHPDVQGTYPFFNLSDKLTLPDSFRLNGIGQAYVHKRLLSTEGYVLRE